MNVLEFVASRFCFFLNEVLSCSFARLIDHLRRVCVSCMLNLGQLLVLVRRVRFELPVPTDVPAVADVRTAGGRSLLEILGLLG